MIELPAQGWFRQDWFGRPCRFRSSYGLDLAPNGFTFCFQSERPPECKPLPPGSFERGLWQEDVAELFIGEPDGAYQEFNFSPSGAWWSAWFDSYRKEVREVPVPRPQIDCRALPAGGWVVRVVLAPEGLVASLRGTPSAELTFNLCAILDPQDPEYLCLGHVSGGEPDFHGRSNFLPWRKTQGLPDF